MKRILLCAAFAAAALAIAGAHSPSHACTGKDMQFGLCNEYEKTAEPAGPEMTDEEIWALPRDERRTKWIEGISCHWVYGTTPQKISYKRNGVAIHDWVDDQAVFKWYVKDDHFCTDGHDRQKYCSQLPDFDVEGEKEWLQNALATSCHN